MQSNLIISTYIHINIGRVERFHRTMQEEFYTIACF